MRRSLGWAGAVLLPLLIGACGGLDRVARLLDQSTPRERYEAALAAAGLEATALARDWFAAAERALSAAPLVTSPYTEEGFLFPGEPDALAFRIAARRGQEIGFEIALAGDSTAQVFVEVWQATGDTTRPLRNVASADSGARSLRFEPRGDGEYVFRAQPELLRGGRYRATIRIAPTLAFPVEGGSEQQVKSGFGDPRDGGVRDHHGIDIFAPRGTPAIAAAEARVSRVGTSPRGGNVVWLRDERGYALYYAHLDRHHVEEGQRVVPGDTIGFVGNTGNARTTRPHLHFGVYRRGEGPVDPWWFVSRSRGSAPALVVDTTLLGAWARTASDRSLLRAAPNLRADSLVVLPRHAAMRVVAAVGSWFRVRLADGVTGYVASNRLEPAERAIAWAPVPVGDSLEVLGRYGAYLLIRAPAGQAGWVSASAQ